MRTALALFCTAFLSALPSLAQTWTATAATGTIDPASTGIYSFSGGTLTYSSSSTSTSPIFARYNVTNTWSSTDTPPWNTLKMCYIDSNSSVSVRTDLYQVNQLGGQAGLCTITSTDSVTANCKTCTFSSTMDFGQYTYYVAGYLQRSSSAANKPVLIGIWIY